MHFSCHFSPNIKQLTLFNVEKNILNLYWHSTGQLDLDFFSSEKMVKSDYSDCCVFMKISGNNENVCINKNNTIRVTEILLLYVEIVEYF